MKTPYGAECSYFYGNYFRGKSDEECRLIPAAGEWSKELCKTCPMPAIQRANSCANLRFKANVTRNWYDFFQKRVVINAFCEKSGKEVPSPHVGCGECHPNLEIFSVSKE